jgi:hypothetical protein
MSACILAKNMPNSHFTSLRGCHALRRHFVGSMLHQFYDIMVGARSLLDSFRSIQRFLLVSVNWFDCILFAICCVALRLL